MFLTENKIRKLIAEERTKTFVSSTEKKEVLKQLFFNALKETIPKSEYTQNSTPDPYNNCGCFCRILHKTKLEVAKILFLEYLNAMEIK